MLIKLAGICNCNYYSFLSDEASNKRSQAGKVIFNN